MSLGSKAYNDLVVVWNGWIFDLIRFTGFLANRAMENPPPVPKQPPEIEEGNLYKAPEQPPQLPAYSAALGVNAVHGNDRTMGMLVHLLGLLTGFIGVLIIWLIKKDQSRFVDFHGREALNFTISMLIYSMCLLVFTFVIAIVTMGLGMFIILPFFFLMAIVPLVCQIIACVAANQGKWHRYPLIIRLIPDPR